MRQRAVADIPESLLSDIRHHHRRARLVAG